jgi:hypothetical protein
MSHLRPEAIAALEEKRMQFFMQPVEDLEKFNESSFF